MRKQEADEIKKLYEEEEAHLLASEVMPQEKLQEQIALLDLLEYVLEEEFPQYSLDTRQDLVDIEEEVLVRVLWFSRGMSDHFLCVSGNGAVVAFNEDLPAKMLRASIKTITKTLQN